MQAKHIRQQLPPIIMTDEEIEQAEEQSLEVEIDWLAAQEQTKRDHKAERTAHADKRALRTKEAAAYIGVSEWHLRTLAHAGVIPVIRTKFWAFDVHDLDAYLERQKEKLL